MFSSAGRSCFGLSKCHPLQGGHAKNCLNHIHRREVPYVEVSNCYPLGGHENCLNPIHRRKVLYLEVSKCYPLRSYLCLAQMYCSAGRSCFMAV